MKRRMICLLLASLIPASLLAACANEDALEMTAITVNAEEPEGCTESAEATEVTAAKTEEKRAVSAQTNGTATEPSVQELSESVAPPASRSPASVQQPATTEALTQPSADHRSEAMGCIGSPVSTLYSIIGSPNSSSYADSCNGGGEDGELYYNGFTVYTYRENGEETVVDVY